jgi:DNA topoisomerase-1
MPDTVHVVAGRCTTVFEGTREQEQHGDAIGLVKPDETE